MSLLYVPNVTYLSPISHTIIKRKAILKIWTPLPPPPLKIVYILYCGLLMALLNPCWLLTAISKGIIIAELKP